MWILPKTLTQSNGSLATVETISDLNECSRICASSLLVRSKSSPSKTFLRRWKQDTWRRLPFGRIAKPSLGNHSLIERIFSSRPILASHLAQPANGKAPTTSGTYGHTFTDGYYAPDLFSSSLRTSKDTYRWDSPQSSAIWKKEVTRRRGEYSARLKSGRLIKERESSSWPTSSARDWKDSAQIHAKIRRDGKSRMDTLGRVVCDLENVDWRTPTAEALGTGEHMNSAKLKLGARVYNKNGKLMAIDLNRQVEILRRQSSQEDQPNWGTPNTMDYMEPRSPEAMKRMLEHGHRKNRKWSSNVREQVVWQEHFGQADQASRSTNGSRLESWATPQAHDAQGPKTPEQIAAMRAKGHGVKNLNEQAAWPTVTSSDYRTPPTNSGTNGQAIMPSSEHALPKVAGGKLNPRWVETLMGLPVGWVMPTCANPVPIEPTNCDCSATELSRPRLNEPSEFSLAS